MFYMKMVRLVIDINLEEVNNNQLDYNEISMVLLCTGTSWQRKCIKYLIENYSGKERAAELKFFIDTQIDMGMIEV